MSLPSWLRRPPRWLCIALLLLAIELVYAFMISGGSLWHWPTWSYIYDFQAQGFRSGHLYLPRTPDPRVLAASDPWDPKLRPLWFWDASLYNGRYYSYWGPLPALALVLVEPLFGAASPIGAPGLGDQYACFALFSLQLVAGALLIDRMALRAFGDVSLARVLGAIALFAFTSPTPWMVARPAIYEGAIVGGAAFLLLGIVFAFDAISAEPDSSAAGRALWLAGLSWALGLGCRVTVGPPAALLIAGTALLLPRPQPSTKRRKTPPNLSPWPTRARAAARMAAPVGASALLLLGYNRLRFDSWLEFGTHWQLSLMRVHTSWSYVFPNVYSYLLRPIWVTCHFPFLVGRRIPEPSWFPPGYALPEGYWTTEHVVGMLFVAPWILLAIPALALTARSALAAARAEGGLVSLEPRARAFLFCGVAFSLALVNGVPMIGQFIAVMRYLGDVVGALALLGIFAAWALRGRFAELPFVHRSLAAAVGLLAAVTIAAGFLFGLQGPEDTLARLSPATFLRLDHTLSFCPADPDPER
ncbi:MAG: hypothetical protein ACHQ6T_17920 [Myxococcota bacterium]